MGGFIRISVLRILRKEREKVDEIEDLVALVDISID